MSGKPHLVCAPEPRVLLGEGPLWDERTDTLYWVDIERGNVHQCGADGSNHRMTSVGERVGCIALREKANGFIAGLEHRIGYLSLDPLSIQPVAAPEHDEPENRSNDGKCDPHGRFWVGTTHMPGLTASAWLYSIAEDGAARRAAGPFVCVNGPTFSPDGATLYLVDTFGKTVYRYSLSEKGDLSDAAPLIHFADPTWGYPDGLTCDLHGCLWVAHWGGWRISRFDPNGELMESIELPVSQVTSCTFGGEGFGRLFITSASIGLKDAAQEPLAGAVFAVEPRIGGARSWRFRG